MGVSYGFTPGGPWDSNKNVVKMEVLMGKP